MGFWDIIKSKDKGQILEKRAALLRKNGDPNGALVALMEQEEYYRNQCPSNILSLASSFGQISQTSQQREDLFIATQLANSASKGKISQYNIIIEHIAKSLADQAALLVELSRRGEAYSRMAEAQSLARGIGNNEIAAEIEGMKKDLGLTDVQLLR